MTISRMLTVDAKKKVLTIKNKNTFSVLTTIITIKKTGPEAF